MVRILLKFCIFRQDKITLVYMIILLILFLFKHIHLAIRKQNQQECRSLEKGAYDCPFSLQYQICKQHDQRNRNDRSLQEDHQKLPEIQRNLTLDGNGSNLG